MKWISIKDRLPEEDNESPDQVLTSNYVEGGNPERIVSCGVFWDGVFYNLEDWGSDLQEEIPFVSHWMPLPDPPK